MKVTKASHSMSQELCELLPRMRRFARSLAGNPHDADDLVQTAVERALARESQWTADLALDAWVFGIVRNAWIDEVRSRRRRWRVFAPEAAGEQVAAPEEGAMAMMSVQAAMAKLPDAHREVVALVLVEGLSYKDAAAVLHVPIGTVMSRLARAREALQRMLGDSRQ